MFTLQIQRNSKFQIIFTVVVTLIAILTLGMARFSTSSSPDHSYDQIEQLRAARAGAAMSDATSYNQVEAVRVGRSLGAVDSSYSQVEQVRSLRGQIDPYADIETLRLER